MAGPGPRRGLSSWARNYIAAPRYAPEERIQLRTADGLRLSAARLTAPGQPLCTVVLVHGFTNWSRHPRVHAFARELAVAADVIVPDLRGHGRSEGRCTLGRDEHHDVAAAVAAARDGLPVVTIGVSMGGAATLSHAGRMGGVAGTVAISAPASWSDLTTHGATRVRRYVRTRTGRLLLRSLCRTRVVPGMPVVFDDAAAVMGSIAPAFVVLVHDTEDRYFPASHAEQLFEWAGQPKDLWWTAGAGHGIDLLTKALAGRLAAALADRLRPRSSPSP